MTAVTAPTVPAWDPTATRPAAITPATVSCSASSVRSSSVVGSVGLRTRAAPRPPSAKKLPIVITVVPKATTPKAFGRSWCARTSVPRNATICAAAARTVSSAAPTAPRSRMEAGLSAASGRPPCALTSVRARTPPTRPRLSMSAS